MYNLSTKEIAYALYGLFLGDGCLKGNIIHIKHTNKQRHYIKFLAKWCKKNNLEFKTKYDFVLNTTLGEFTYSSIQITIPVAARKHFKKFNRSSKEVLSPYVLNRISSLGILFWYLDDGTLSAHQKKDGISITRFAYLNTQGFSLSEQKKIQKMFKDRFDIDTRIHIDRGGMNDKNKEYYRIYFNATNFRKLYDMVREYFVNIPIEFEYKFNMKYKINRMSNSKFLSENYNYNDVKQTHEVHCKPMAVEISSSLVGDEDIV